MTQSSRRFDFVETRLIEAFIIVCNDSAQPTYLETICVHSDVSQISVVKRRRKWLRKRAVTSAGVHSLGLVTTASCVTKSPHNSVPSPEPGARVLRDETW